MSPKQKINSKNILSENYKNLNKLKNPLPSKYSSTLYLGFSGLFLFSIVIYIPYIKPIINSFFKNNSEITHIAYFDIGLKESNVNYRIDIGLFMNESPKNVNNFLTLISNNTSNNIPKEAITYKNTKATRSYPGYMIFFGDVTNDDGSGHYSIYNNDYIENEISNKVKLNYNFKGVVGVCNLDQDISYKNYHGKTNGSQFFITLDSLPSLNNKYTVIGEVIRGFDNLYKISGYIGNKDGKPDQDIIIKNCGIYVYEDYIKEKKMLKEYSF